MARRRRVRKQATEEIEDVDLSVVRSFIEEGLTDPQIAAELRIRISTVVLARREIIQAALLEIGPNRPVTEVFTEHRLRMNKVMKDLDALATACKAEKEHITLGALKAKAKIADDLLDRGQELGVLPRAARKSSGSSVNVAVGVSVGTMADTELVNHLGGLNRDGKRLRDEYEDVPFMDLEEPVVYPDVIDVEPEPDAPKPVRRRKA